MAGLLSQVSCPVVLARGEHDPMVSHEQLAVLVPVPVTLAGLGHNAHVESPESVLGLLR
jgi:pimeloyl-ACP methyl ester carboxylesterase